MTDVMIRGDGDLPIYVQLENLVRDRIDNGEWAPGMMLPSERQLCDTYGIARMTVRQAISNLVIEGLLTRTQGRGTFVARPRLRQSLSRLTSFSEDMRDRGLLGTTRLLAREEMPASPEIASALAIAVGAPVLQIQRLRSGNGHPMAVETSTQASLPCSPDGGHVYVWVAREGSHRRALTPGEIRELLSRRGLFAFDRLPVPGTTRADLDDRLVEQFVARFRSGRRMEADLP